MVRRLVWFFTIVGILIFAGITAMLFTEASHVRVPAIAALVTFAAIVLALIKIVGLDTVVALIIGNTAYLVLVPFIFRYSRVLWLHLDWLIDPEEQR